MPTPVAEAYLETIYNLAMETDRVRAVDLATRFRVSRPTVTQTVNKLEIEGLISQDRAGGLKLTDQGNMEAEGLLRRHRLAERLLFDVLGMDFVSAHEEAHALEHWISPEVESRISTLLREPATCPHGNPIPGNGPAGVDFLRQQSAIRLTDVPQGSEVLIVSISEVVEDESALLTSLEDKEIVPGRQLLVHDCDEGTVIYFVNERSHRLERSLAEKIWVTRTDVDSVARSTVSMENSAS